jgi:hypothetical protein
MLRIVRTIINYHDTRIIEALFSTNIFDTLLKVLKCSPLSKVYSESNPRNLDYNALFHQRFQHKSLIHFDQVNT